MLEQKKQGKSIPQILKENGEDINMITETVNYRQFNPFDGKVYEIKPGGYDPNILGFDENIYYHGYWLNREWFKKYKQQFLKEFQFPLITDEYNKSLMDRILNANSTAIHIRRGDFVDINIAYDANKYREMTQKYLDYFGGDTTLFVFSDDITWCKENSDAMLMNQFKDCVFVEGNMNGKNYMDLQLMSHCRYMIIGHSSFAFLAALLNTGLLGCINASDREI